MDHFTYIDEVVKDENTKERILNHIKFYQDCMGDKWMRGFSNNFFDNLPGFKTRAIWESKYKHEGENPEKKFGEYEGYENASDKLKQQTPREFFKTIDDTIEKLDFAQIDVINAVYRMPSSKEKAHNYLFKIMVDLMCQGYELYPDLSR